MSIPQRHSEVTDHASRVNRAGTSEHPRAYGRACRLAVRGRYDQARRLYASLSRQGMESRLQALITSDLASLAAIEGRLDEAREGWLAALELDTGCLPARLNRDFAQGIADHVGPDASHALLPRAARPDIPARPEPRPPDSDGRSTKVALLSFLFNLAIDRGRQHSHRRAGAVPRPCRIRRPAHSHPVRRVGNRRRPTGVADRRRGPRI
jgi:hypothetical protein